MVEMQIMNIVNVGVKENMSIDDIEILADAMINATQLFLSDVEVDVLRKKLLQRLEKQKLIV